MNRPQVFRESDRNNLELVRQIVFNRLKHDSNWKQFDYVWGERDQAFVKFENKYLRDRFLVLVNEVMWQLLVQGVITAGMNSSNPTLPFFRLTDYGKKVLEAERFIPHDPTGYLKGLRATTGTIAKDVAISYMEEALRCFNSGCNLASVLLLGVAAESVFNQLCDVIKPSLKNNSEQKKLADKLSVKPRHRWIVQKYQSLPSKVRREQLPESLDMTLTSLYDLIRRQRNDLGHPQEKPPDLSREQAFMFFRLFPEFVSDIEAFAKYCQKHGL